MSASIPWWTPQLAGTEMVRLEAVLASNYLNDGDVTAEFESEMARLTGARHAIAVTSGTTALFLALAAIGVGPGDEVIVPDVTFIASANAVRLAGAFPILVDVDPTTLTLDPELTRAAITTRTKAIMPVHLSGRSGKLPELMALAAHHGLAIVEDAAEGFMSAINGRCLGTFGQAGCLSFSPNKTISTGQGGMVLTNDDAVILRLRELKDHGRHGRGTGGDDVHHAVGFNFKLTNLQAAIGLAQLKALPHRLERQRAIYRLYQAQLADVSEVQLLGFNVDHGEVPQWTDIVVERRDELDQYLQMKGAQCRRFWFPLHTQKPYLQPDEKFPNSTHGVKRAMWLPSAFTLSDQDILTVCQEIHAFFRR